MDYDSLLLISHFTWPTESVNYILAQLIKDRNETKVSHIFKEQAVDVTVGNCESFQCL